MKSWRKECHWEKIGLRPHEKWEEKVMGIKEEIFEEFLKKLEEDEGFPRSIIEELRKLWGSEEVISQEKIREVIKRGCENVDKV